MSNERGFKGIWIPREVWLDSNLTIQEKVFLVEIDSLDNESGCFASNGYFAEFFGISKTRVSLVIKSLIEKDCVTSQIKYREGTQEILNRVLKVCYSPPLTKVKDPTQQKLKGNNTFNNKINNTYKKESANAFSSEKGVIFFPLKDGPDFHVTEKFIEELRPLYRNITIETELNKMKAWLIGNPAKKKTKTGIKRFITSWLLRAEEKNKGTVGNMPPDISEMDLYAD